MSNDLLIFTLGEQRFALPVQWVSRVVPRARLTAMPGAPAALIGVLRLRGVLVPVVDLRSCLGLPATEPHIGECIVVLETAACGVGLLVEGVNGVVSAVGRVLEASGHVVTTLDLHKVLPSELRTYLMAFEERVAA